ncbi:MAG: thioesterase family protein, partial [Myxococcales bacterium]|nr:thioesterase family protein [Myxococcales bacterium]
MSFYLRDGEHLRATPLTRGPWDPAHQHGGPPCALLAGAVARWGEGATGPEGFAVARFAAEYARPVPVDAHLEVRVEPDRLGGQVQRFDATLLADGREAIRARVLRVRRAPLPVTAEPPPDAPHTLSDFSFPFFAWEPAYHTAVQ